MIAYFLYPCHAEYDRAAGEGQDAQKVWTLVVLEEKRHGQKPGTFLGIPVNGYSLSYDGVPARKEMSHV